MNRTTFRLATLAGLVFLCSLFAIGAQWAPFSHAAHPVAFAGMRGVPGAALFNGMVFVLPGLLLVLVGGRLRGALPAQARWQPRIGATLLVLSAVAFAAQGLLPLDPEDIDGGTSSLHATAWTMWWIAFATGAVLYARASLVEHLVAVGAVLLVLVIGLYGREWMPAGIAQRVAFCAWFAWYAYAAWRGRR